MRWRLAGSSGRPIALTQVGLLGVYYKRRGIITKATYRPSPYVVAQEETPENQRAEVLSRVDGPRLWARPTVRRDITDNSR